ncbi:MAG TPA: SDR family oxidoreductase [Spirochaetia bacterium]|nr:SDR family oxidoreductase [Spirochaetia bacterium]
MIICLAQKALPPVVWHDIDILEGWRTSGHGNYASAKAGLIGLTKAVAKEVGSRNITVNAVAPGLIGTDVSVSMSKEQWARMSSSIILGKAVRPEYVAALVAFSASRQAGYISGQVIGLDGSLVI